MPSKEEIEKIKRELTEELGRTITANECGLSTNDFSESIEILEGALKYIKQLEAREQKLIEKLKEQADKKIPLAEDADYVQGYRDLARDLLEILKGESDE